MRGFKDSSTAHKRSTRRPPCLPFDISVDPLQMFLEGFNERSRALNADREGIKLAHQAAKRGQTKAERELKQLRDQLAEREAEKQV